MLNKKLHILFLAGWYPNRVIPTDGNFVQKHAEAVAMQSNVIALHVCADANNTSKIETVVTRINKVDTVNVYFKPPSHQIPVVTKIQKTIRQIRAYKAGLKKVHEIFPTIDIVHLNILYPAGIVAWHLKRKNKLPYVVTEHHTIYTPFNKAVPGFLQKVMSKIIARNAACIMPVTENLRDGMMGYGLEAKYQVVGNVVDTEIFHPPTTRTVPKKIRFLHVSSLKDSQKNLSGMLRVTAQLAQRRNDFECWFIGDGDITPHMELAKKLGIYNSFAFFDGTKTTTQVAELMRNSHCLLLFSHYENFPCVIVEAMATGIPVISTRVGGIAEHLTDDYGVLVNPNDEEGLLTAMNNTIDSIIQAKYNPLVLQQYAQLNFSYQQISIKFNEIYQEVLKAHV